MMLPFTVWLLFATSNVTLPQRSIDRCAQDGAFFYAMSDDPTRPVQVERDGVAIRIEHPDSKSADARVSFSKANRVLVQMHTDFEAALGWLAVSPTGAFATTWQVNASSAETQLFRVTSNGGIIEDTDLIPSAEETFVIDAKRFCKSPGVNTTAIKWIDDDHLLLSINAWSSGFCSSNFTEGFILSVSKREFTRKLSERELINLPAVCTWNLVPVKTR
ncbi:MAG: hypothetical protein ABSC48_19340 [Terracidiphilus sp.]|jgi:hypothetical protein